MGLEPLLASCSRTLSLLGAKWNARRKAAYGDFQRSDHPPRAPIPLAVVVNDRRQPADSPGLTLDHLLGNCLATGSAMSLDRSDLAVQTTGMLLPVRLVALPPELDGNLGLAAAAKPRGCEPPSC